MVPVMDSWRPIIQVLGARPATPHLESVCGVCMIIIATRSIGCLNSCRCFNLLGFGIPCTGGTAATATDGTCEAGGDEDCTACDTGYTLNGQVCDATAPASVSLTVPLDIDLSTVADEDLATLKDDLLATFAEAGSFNTADVERVELYQDGKVFGAPLQTSTTVEQPVATAVAVPTPVPYGPWSGTQCQSRGTDGFSRARECVLVSNLLARVVNWRHTNQR